MYGILTVGGFFACKQMRKKKENLFLLSNALLGILYTNVYNMEVLGNFDTYWHIPDTIQISLWILENT